MNWPFATPLHSMTAAQRSLLGALMEPERPRVYSKSDMQRIASQNQAQLEQMKQAQQAKKMQNK